MRGETGQTTQLQRCLDRLQAGDESARTELLTRTCERLTRLTRKMLRGNPRVKRWEETDDVSQNASMRLYRALEQVRPASVDEFFRLAALQIRRELIDLARHYHGPEGLGENYATDHPLPNTDTKQHGAADQPDTTHEPSRLAMWAEFHQRVEALPDEEREVFDLLFYQGLTQAEAGALLKVPERTLQRRWQAARLRLREMFPGAV